MDRLTVKSKTPGLNHALKVMRIGYTEDNCKDICSEHDFAGELHCTECGIQKAIEKRAAYEDTGLTPEEITAMKADNEKLHKFVDATLKMFWDDTEEGEDNADSPDNT